MGSTNPTVGNWVDADQLHHFIHQALEQYGLSVADANLLADHFVWAELQGMPCLGISNLPWYLAALRAGAAATASGEPKVALRRGGFLVVDAEDALGPLVGHRVMAEVIETARSTGVSAALIRNITGPVAQGYVASLAVDEQMVGLAMNSGQPRELSPGASYEAGAINTLAIASPAGQNPPLMLNMARSGIGLAQVAGQAPFDPVAAFDEMLRPVHESSFGLAMLWKVLTAVLSTSETSAIDRSSPTDASQQRSGSMLLLALDPTVSVPYESFVSSVDKLIDRIYASSPACGGSEQQRSPGMQNVEQRPTNGISLPGAVRTMLRATAAELGISLAV
ncbi:Ldh family oxidoreductase [Kribbella shirazensis]|uniref:LDH2 family malate/lactate/ureidoglycolate dehydrogenase n=1 Tax=Kribbella shirazensis TaxID=1105143 RepID=A0A7X6A5L3_9ACTN|nr:Ldh family oxidoreductase [Kribbella shirazensis]NIK61399.1 LDH2 family malate/lactate/ureidoglycolate dehydrogenase [Kribbella shirazensis]